MCMSHVLYCIFVGLAGVMRDISDGAAFKKLEKDAGLCAMFMLTWNNGRMAFNVITVLICHLSIWCRFK
jgi:hypothetical protein